MDEPFGASDPCACGRALHVPARRKAGQPWVVLLVTVSSALGRIRYLVKHGAGNNPGRATKPPSSGAPVISFPESQRRLNGPGPASRVLQKKPGGPGLSPRS